MQVEMSKCVGCGGGISVDGSHIVDGDAYCNDCYDKRFVVCHDCEDIISIDNSHPVDGNAYCDDCYDERFVECNDCGDIIAREDEADYHIVDDNAYCDDCYNERYVTCDGCGGVISIDDSHHVDDNAYCDDCYSERFVECYHCGDIISIDDACYYHDESYCERCAPCDVEWESARFVSNGGWEDMGSFRRFGVELETSACPDYEDLRDITVFGAKHDGSIRGMEFVSPILSKDAGLKAIDDFCQKANHLGFQVDEDCGLHAHFDVSTESVEGLKSIAFAYHMTYAVWALFVPAERRKNHYCRPNDWKIEDLAKVHDFDDWRAFLRTAGNRYKWFNLQAYNVHNTFEVRLHTATLNAEKICNWVKAHARFMDWAADKSFDEIGAQFGDVQFGGDVDSQFAGFAEVWNDEKLTEFYAERAAKFGHPLNILATV